MQSKTEVNPKSPPPAPFDTLDASQRLEKSAMPGEQAVAVVEVVKSHLMYWALGCTGLTIAILGTLITLTRG